MKFKKHFLFLCLLIIPLLLLAKVTYPKPVGFVNDFAGVLSSETKLELDNLLTELREKTNVDIAVVTVDNMQGLDRDTYAVELFKEWKIGSKNDEGLLFLLAKEERQTKVEVGYGLEGLINDAKAGRVLDEYAVPFFKKNDFDSGLKSATIVFSEIIANDKGVTLTGVAEVTQVDEKSSSSTGLLVVLGIIIFLTIITRGRFLFWLLLLLSRGGGGSSRGGGFGGFGGGSSGGGGAGRSF